MTRPFHTMMGLLLSFIRAGINGEYSLIHAGRSFNIRLSHDTAACYHLWRLNTLEKRDFIAVVANGEIQTSSLYGDDSDWTLEIKDLTEDDAGHNRCPQTTGHTAASKVIVVPSQTSTLQCVLLTNTRQQHCHTQLQQAVSLMWVDEGGAQMPEHSQQQIQQRSSCNVSFMLAPLSPVNKKYRCQVTVGDQVQISVDVWVRPPGRGRGMILEPETGHQDHSQVPVGAAVGGVGCVVLTALIAAFAVKRKIAKIRPSASDRQLPDESCNTIRSNHVMNTDYVIYADIVLPVCSGGVRVEDCEDTEYACIRFESCK